MWRKCNLYKNIHFDINCLKSLFIKNENISLNNHLNYGTGIIRNISGFPGTGRRSSILQQAFAGSRRKDHQNRETGG